jgi:hypothetical protein
VPGDRTLGSGALVKFFSVKLRCGEKACAKDGLSAQCPAIVLSNFMPETSRDGRPEKWVNLQPFRI